jgi:hypothetical protein
LRKNRLAAKAQPNRIYVPSLFRKNTFSGIADGLKGRKKVLHTQKSVILARNNPMQQVNYP